MTHSGQTIAMLWRAACRTADALGLLLPVVVQSDDGVTYVAHCTDQFEARADDPETALAGLCDALSSELRKRGGR